jgi:adenosylmethionine-8-amino-7-oxononanoate aminotransferase
MEDFVFHRNWRKQFPSIERGEGVYLYDRSGKRYIDAAGGVLVVSIGHGVPEIGEAVAQAMSRCAFPYNATFASDAETQLAEKVIRLAPEGMKKVYFTCGGSEANEAALKFARQYHLLRGKPEKWKFIGRWYSYHGATVGTLSMTGQVSNRKDYLPYLLPFPHIAPCYCFRCPFGKQHPGCGLECAWDLERVIRNEGPQTVAAFIAEPILGSHLAAATPPPGYFDIIREICNRYDVLFILDEVITGFGRTGKKFACEHWNVTPDMMTLGKGISSGYTPLGGIVLHGKITEAFAQSSRSTFFLGYTFSRHPASCAGGLAVQEYVERNRLIARAETMGAYLHRKAAALKELPFVGDVRGKGMLLGVELVGPKGAPLSKKSRAAERVAARIFSKGATVVASSPEPGNVLSDYLQVGPPFVIRESEIDEVVDIFRQSIAEVFGEIQKEGLWG